jgi:hypothetical protein
MNKTCLECKCQFNTNEAWKTLCLDCYKKSKGYIKNTNNIDADLLKKLIYLCHPDKHNQSVISITVTKYLLSLK